MSEFFGFVGKEPPGASSYVAEKLNATYKGPSFKCFYEIGFDLAVYQDDFLFVVSLGYLSSTRSKNLSLERSASSCAIDIANLYSSNADDFYNLIDGNFSFCIFDKVMNKTILARDTMGSRPLYLCFQEDCLIFSSNEKYFLDSNSLSISLDKETMASYIALKPLHSEKTFFNEIKRLTPSTNLLVDNNSLELSYNNYPLKKIDLSISDPLETFRYKFEAAIKRCWKNSSKIGLMFSGGLDSSSIAVGLKNSGFKDIQSFSCNYSHLPSSIRALADEVEFQSSVINSLGLSHTSIELGNVSPLQSLTNQFKYFAEPMHLPNLYMFEKVAFEAQEKNIGVIFDGQDGDSVISHGLERFRELAKVGNLFSIFYELICYSRYNGIKFKNIFRFILVALLKHWGLIKKNIINSSVLNQRVFERYFAKHDKSVTAVDSHLDKLSSPLHSIALETKYLFFKKYLIHVRSPFYDRELMEFCVSIPSKWKLQSGKTRFILRKYLSIMGLTKVSCRKNKANLGYGLVDNIRRLDLDRIHHELEDIHPFLQEFVNQERINKFFLDFKSNDSWQDKELMGLLAVYTASYWLKNELNIEVN